MKKSLLKSLALVIMTSLLTLSIVAASPQIYKITAYMNNELKFTFNGEGFQPKDENGKKLTPIVYDNRTYLPVRSIAELTGLDVDYDEESNTIIIAENTSGGIPYNDGKPGKDPITAPKLESKIINDKLVLMWDKVSDSRLQGYKVVISESDSTPVYPDNGYLFYITDKNQTSAIIDNNNQYNSGDFGKYLTPGETYYFSITVLYSGGKVSSNTLKLIYPEE